VTREYVLKVVAERQFFKRSCSVV